MIKINCKTVRNKFDLRVKGNSLLSPKTGLKMYQKLYDYFVSITILKNFPSSKLQTDKWVYKQTEQQSKRQPGKRT